MTINASNEFKRRAASTIDPWGNALEAQHGNEELIKFLEDALQVFKDSIADLTTWSSELYRDHFVVHSGYTENNQLRACCDSDYDSGNHFIAVSSGLALTLHRLFRLVVASGTLFPSLDNTVKDGIDFSGLPLIDTYEELHGTNSIRIPLSDRRKKAADFLAQMALFYIFHHEYAHIWHGHGKAQLIAREAGFEKEEVDLTSISCEMMADSRAFHVTFDYYLVAYLSQSSALSPFERSFHLMDMGNAFLTTIYLALRHSDKSIRLSGVEPKSAGRPPLKFRVIHLASQLAGSMQDQFGQSKTIRLQANLEHLRGLDKIYTKSFPAETPLDLVDDDLKAYDEWIPAVIEASDKVRPLMMPLKRGAVYPVDVGSQNFVPLPYPMNVIPHYIEHLESVHPSDRERVTCLLLTTPRLKRSESVYTLPLYDIKPEELAEFSKGCAV